ncbi:hypothetical protein [Zooshikella ganghwensis]|uniref:hypothetical protein n=1 Tax=Zooshikella ganghwensis TaxID=202772 RepID=UPI000485BAAD|nr:hypothetical protein [Zooshikella ganghwensis]
MKNNILASSILIAISSSTFATNGPLYKNNCPQTINHPLLGTGVYFDELCKTAYVTPPIFGEFRVINLTVGAESYRNCSILKESAKLNETRSSIISLQQERVNEYKLNLKESNLKNLESEIDFLEKKVEAIKSKEAILEKETYSIELEIKPFLEDYKKCKKSPLNTEEDCKPHKDNVQELYRKVEKIQKSKLDPLINERFDLEAKIGYLEIDIKSEADKELQYQKDLEAIEGISNDINRLVEQMDNIYKEVRSLPGGDIAVEYYVDWHDLINKYQFLNNGLNINWQSIPISKATFSINLRSDDLTINKAPLVLATSLAGVSLNQGSVINPPEGETIEPLKNKPISLNPASVGFSDSMSASMTLSVPAVCYILNDDLSTPDDISKNIMSYLSSRVDYNYHPKVRRKYTAKFNLEALYKRIEKLKSKGGFFSSKAKHEIIEDKNSKEIFDIKFDADDSYFSWTPEEQDKLTKDIKATLLNRVLKQISLFNNLGTNLTLPTAPETGVGKLADLLNNGDCAKPEVKAKAEEAVANENNPSSVSNNDDSTPENNKPADTVKAFNDACKFTFDKNLLGSLVKDKDSVLASVASNFSSGNFLAIPGSILSSFSSSSTKVSFFQNNSHTAEEKVDQVSFVDKTTTVTFRSKAK